MVYKYRRGVGVARDRVWLRAKFASAHRAWQAQISYIMPTPSGWQRRKRSGHIAKRPSGMQSEPESSLESSGNSPAAVQSAIITAQPPHPRLGLETERIQREARAQHSSAAFSGVAVELLRSQHGTPEVVT